MKKKIFFWFFIWGAFLPKAQIFTWKNPNLSQIDTLKTEFLLNQKINSDFFKKDTANFIIKDKKVLYEEGILVKKNTRAQLLGDLNAKGSIIRGITFGNNQGQSVQSSMDLQITGKLSKDVSISASISDHNLPIQADGYTQNLQEFDKIFLQLTIKNKSILKAGHLDLLDDKTYFGKYQRRSMGIGFQTNFGKENKTTVDFSAGIARSEFYRVRFQGVEGNQGPYRLSGKNGESFITIISGSEQVYIDGILMKRGEKEDYTINYNTGEVTFTTYKPIYKQNFITISYNYTNRNYNRFIITSAVKHETEKLKLSFSAFLENDNKNAPLSLNLSKEDEQILANAGNNQDLMFAPSAVLTEYDVNKILYKLVENPQGNYYQFSSEKTEKLYQVAFTYFGTGKGDYQIKQSTNNGRIFQYVSSGKGDYAALRKLPAPQKSQVFSTSVAYALSQGIIGGDFSLSNYDVNLFSSKNNNQNTGFAARFYGNKTLTKNNWRGTLGAEYQRISSQFHILDRINDVEFSRDFNLSQEFSQITQDRFIVSFANSWKNGNAVNYKLNYINEKETYQGIKNDIDFRFSAKKSINKGYFSYLNTNTMFQATEFAKGNISTDFFGKKGSWSLGGSFEHNVKNYKQNNTLDVTSFSWKEIFIQKKVGDSLRTKFLAKTYLRTNDSVRDNVLKRMNTLVGVMLESQVIKNQKTQLSTLIHYRKFFYEPEFKKQFNSDFVIGNIQYNQQFLKNGIRLQAFYELGNGQEAQREFQYIKVTDGQGIYKWTDYNGDGIQQLDEFEIAEYADLAKYIRVYTNTVKYTPSNKNKLQVSVSVNPYLAFTSENQFLKRWNFNISFTAQNSFYKENKVLEFNPFKTENNQILKNQNFLFSVLFNPTEKSGWNGNYRFIDQQNLVNANFSIEKKATQTHLIDLGYWFNKNLKGLWQNQYQNYQSSSQLFTTRDYVLNILESKPKITYQLTEHIQSELSSAYRLKIRKDGEELLKTYDVTGTLQWEKKKTSIRGNFSFIQNNFTGNSFSIVGNQMLDGLKPGKNQVWSIILQQSLNSFLQLNVNYEGRNSSERTIHIGSVQVKANF